MNLVPSSDENSANKNIEKISSRINPCLIRLAYPLGCYFVLPLFFRQIDIIGRENVPQTGPVLVAPTHRSRWDALILPSAIGRLASGRDLRFMVTADEYNRPIQGWFIRRMGGFPVNVNRPDRGSISHSIDLLSQGEMLAIFPEGDIVRDTKVSPLKRGVARIALDVEAAHPGCGIKILPVSLKYDSLYPSWGDRVTVKIGEPINVASYSSASIRKGSEKLTRVLETALTNLHEEPTSAIPVATA
ncbi:MAG: 1-acyl-sn-glycerol-3-phosphate acyltransferase [Hydrococcus sp. Prado102]|jgi:1-acyl-sn-glycerol-3-phosphate acyltransferase|nr:1-acyl-sn-glycerol-3-phosphate acyltransferase [Hydrococcus sp. Prado102]